LPSFTISLLEVGALAVAARASVKRKSDSSPVAFAS
jgi:hypothetical protein